ncbi:unnamed protein product [Durusdinium trenchii]|uniref:Uncharacterized protein n=1 Tax=Durusdinium trenchii TaxID=1381693 RepID=A0ABP0NBU2_9DINO
MADSAGLAVLRPRVNRASGSSAVPRRTAVKSAAKAMLAGKRRSSSVEAVESSSGGEAERLQHEAQQALARLMHEKRQELEQIRQEAKQRQLAQLRSRLQQQQVLVTGATSEPAGAPARAPAERLRRQLLRARAPEEAESLQSVESSSEAQLAEEEEEEEEEEEDEEDEEEEPRHVKRKARRMDEVDRKPVQLKAKAASKALLIPRARGEG